MVAGEARPSHAGRSKALPPIPALHGAKRLFLQRPHQRIAAFNNAATDARATRKRLRNQGACNMKKLSRAERKRRAEVAASPFGIHEALHTAHVLMDTYSSYVAEHPAVEERPEILALAVKAIEAMMDVYQALGNLPEWYGSDA